MLYEIVAYYVTGDTFKPYNTSTSLAATWDSLDKAKKALDLLDEHHKCYEEINDRFRYTPKEDIDVTGKPWYVEDPSTTCKWKDFWEHCIVIPDNNGTLVKESIPYHGYSEHLTELKIEVAKAPRF